MIRVEHLTNPFGQRTVWASEFVLYRRQGSCSDRK